MGFVMSKYQNLVEVLNAALAAKQDLAIARSILKGAYGKEIISNVDVFKADPDLRIRLYDTGDALFKVLVTEFDTGHVWHPRERHEINVSGRAWAGWFSDGGLGERVSFTPSWGHELERIPDPVIALSIGKAMISYYKMPYDIQKMEWFEKYANRYRDLVFA